MSGDERAERVSRILRSEFLFDQPVQVMTYRRMIEALDYFVQKASDEEPLRHLSWDAARAQVKQLIFFNLAGGCAVGASDIVGENFKAGH